MEKEIDGEILLHDTTNGSVHHLNLVAGMVWRLCDGTKNTEAITDEIAKAFQKSPAEIASDIEEVLVSFKNKGLLT